MKDSHYIDNLQLTKKSEEIGKKFKSDLHNGRYRRFNPNDSFKNRIPVVVIQTKGKGKRECLQNIINCFADSGRIGKCWGELYLYDSLRTFGYPRKFKITGDRILIDSFYKEK